MTTLTGTESPSDTTAKAPQEFDVAVIFSNEDFTLSVRWTTDAGVDDETRAAAAAEWFYESHGLDVWDCDGDVEVTIKDLGPAGSAERSLPVIRCNDCDALTYQSVATSVFDAIYFVCESCADKNYHFCDTCDTAVPDEGGCGHGRVG